MKKKKQGRSRGPEDRSGGGNQRGPDSSRRDGQRDNTRPSGGGGSGSGFVIRDRAGKEHPIGRRPAEPAGEGRNPRIPHSRSTEGGWQGGSEAPRPVRNPPSAPVGEKAKPRFDRTEKPSRRERKDRNGRTERSDRSDRGGPGARDSRSLGSDRGPKPNPSFRDERGSRNDRAGGASSGYGKRSQGGGPGNRDFKPSRGRNPGSKDSGRSKAPRERFPDRSSMQMESTSTRGQAPEGGRIVKATVDKNRKGFAFLIPDTKGSDDFFVPPREAEKFFHGDRVEVTVSKRGDILAVSVLNHRFRELFGKFTPDGRTSGWIIYEKKKAREEVFVEKAPEGIKSGDWVHAKLHFHETGRHPVTGEIIEVFGEVLPARIDVEWIAGEYNLIEKHPEAAVKEAESFKLDLSEVESGIRKDLRHVPFITIDGETARDFDDAVYVERKGAGYVLWVAIADVSFYVKPGTALDKDARSRGTSVYFPERAFHMLPRALSEGLCSLKPREPRLAMVARMDYDETGKRTHTEVMDAVIESKRRATYNEIQKETELHGNDLKWEYRPHLELYRLIRQKRNSRGSIDFDLPEAEVLVDDKGEPTRIFNRARQDSHRLIEEFMISANEAVTEWALAKDLPFLYRVHDVPSEKALERFQNLAEHLGVTVSLSDDNLMLELSEFIRSIEGHPAQGMMNIALLRSMKQAVYSSLHGIHFGLASEGYTHFTSPIRRYPDLVVHRMLRLAIRGEKIDRDRLEQELEAVAEHCSYRERLASDADREAIKLKQVRIMMAHMGEEFVGKVMGVMESGFFIQLDEPFVEGMVPIDTMDDDAYEYDENRMWLLGRRTRRIIQVGDRVKVQVARAELERREIDFACIEHTPQKGLAGETSMLGRSAHTQRDRGPRAMTQPTQDAGGYGRRKKKSSSETSTSGGDRFKGSSKNKKKPRSR